MIIVQKLNWLDEESGEADITLTDGKYSLDCFCSDCNLLMGDTFSDMLYGFNIQNIMRSLSPKDLVNKNNENYHLQGVLRNKEESIMQVGEFKIDLSEGDIPKDINENEYIEVEISRIDIY